MAVDYQNSRTEDENERFQKTTPSRKAKAAREEATVKLQRIKYWQKELGRQLLNLRGSLQPLRNWAELDVPTCVSYIRAMEAHLEGYLTELPKPPSPTSDQDNPRTNEGDE